MIDGALVNGSARVVGWFAGVVRWLQTGYIYHYAFAMIARRVRADDLVRQLADDPANGSSK